MNGFRSDRVIYRSKFGVKMYTNDRSFDMLFMWRVTDESDDRNWDGENSMKTREVMENQFWEQWSYYEKEEGIVPDAPAASGRAQ